MKLTVKQEHEQAVKNLNGAAVWRWLFENGYQGVLRDGAYRRVFGALVEDSCHWLYESLIACAKGKHTVAFALLRKPFKENLLLLEWLCGAPAEFIDAFHGEAVWAYAPSRFNPEKTKRIIESAARELGDASTISAEWLYDFRYNKRYEAGLESQWQKATHIVTTVEHIATERTNLNFVFSTDMERRTQWGYYYYVVPILLNYTLVVVDHVLGRLITWNKDKRALQGILRALAFARWAETSPTVNANPAEVDGLLGALSNLLESRCDSCSQSLEFPRSDVDRLWSSAEVKCQSCGEITDIWRDCFPEDYEADE